MVLRTLPQRWWPFVSNHGSIEGYPVNDALVGEVFTGAYKRGQVEVDNRVQMINKRLKTVHSVACGIMMTLVKGSVEVCFLGWTHATRTVLAALTPLTAYTA